jgi:hypothetical protein
VCNEFRDAVRSSKSQKGRAAFVCDAKTCDATRRRQRQFELLCVPTILHFCVDRHLRPSISDQSRSFSCLCINEQSGFSIYTHSPPCGKHRSFVIRLMHRLCSCGHAASAVVVRANLSKHFRTPFHSCSSIEVVATGSPLPQRYW